LKRQRDDGTIGRAACRPGSAISCGQSVSDGSTSAARRRPLGAAAISAAPIATIGNPSQVEGNGRCEAIGFSVQLFAAAVYPGKGN
jgi:hypothetical protein